MQDTSKLMAVYEVAKTQVEVMEGIIEEGKEDDNKALNNLYAEGILEGWVQARNMIKRITELE